MKGAGPPEGSIEDARRDARAASPFDPLACIDAVAPAVGLVIAAEHREAVAANLARLHALAQELPELDPAPQQDRGVS